MTQIARPSEDIITGGWTPTPLYQHVNSLHPDLQPITSPDLPPAATFTVRLGRVARPRAGPHVLAIDLGYGGCPVLAALNLYSAGTLVAGRSLYAPAGTYQMELTEQEISRIRDYEDLSLSVRVEDQCPASSGSEGSGSGGSVASGSGSLASGSGSASSVSGSGSGDPCCGGLIPETIYATFADAGGCAHADGMVLTLTKVAPTAWNVTGAAGGCGFPTIGGFDCTTGLFSVVFGADNQGRGYPLTFSCSPFFATYQFTFTYAADPTCCDGQVSVTLSE